MEYRLATHLGSGEVVYTVDDIGLRVHREKTGQLERIPFSDVASINLRQDMPGAFVARVVRSVGSPILIPARHFRGLGQFEPRTAEYRSFVSELLARSHARNPSIRYTAGSTGFYWLGWGLIVSGAALGALFVAVLLMARNGVPWHVLVAVPAAIAVGAGFVRQGRGIEYDPAAPPEHLLPQP